MLDRANANVFPSFHTGTDLPYPISDSLVGFERDGRTDYVMFVFRTRTILMRLSLHLNSQMEAELLHNHSYKAPSNLGPQAYA